MGKNLSALLKKVFLGSLSGIATSNSISASDKMNDFSSDLIADRFETSLIKKNDLKPKLILKKIIGNEVSLISHRSHRSHSSHRSHYSSSSGTGTGTGTGTGGVPQSKPSSPPEYQKPIQTQPDTIQSNPGLKPGENFKPKKDSTSGSLKLGSRTLKKGMSGTDVTELINILIKKKYLKLNNGATKVSGSSIFSQLVEDAVKNFQTDNGLPSDGICNASTIYYLKNK
ncbi:MAG: peptidoglycan-binding protein [Bacteroidetes bacterium]|nr:MAG: peptidoglycan-binding protein [Bacteroidota bacterium]